MGAVIQNGNFVGGLDAAVAAKIGTDTLTTSASDLSGAVNELDAELGNETLPDPSKTVKGNINSLNQSLSDLETLEKTASGAIATFDDGSALPMPSLKVAIEPQQDLHGYDAPWVGGAGKNKFDADTTYSSYKQSDGSFRITGNAATNLLNYIPASLVGNELTVSVYFDLSKEASPTRIRIASVVNGVTTESERVDLNEKKRVSLTFTPTSTSDYWSITYGSTGTNYFTFEDCQLEISSTPTSFAPYSNICPISGCDEVNVGVVGKNLFDRDSIRRGVYTKEDGTTQSGSATTNFSSQFIKVKPNTIYSITMFGESYEKGSLFGIYYDKDKNGINQKANIQNLISNSSKTFTTPSNAHYIVFTGYRGSGTDIFTTANTMVCEGASTTYEPYNGSTYTIDLDGTRYGGTLDVVNGVLTVDRVSVTVDENSNIISGSGGLPFRIDLLTEAKASSSASALTGVKCNFLKEVTQSSSWGVDGTFSRVTTDAKIVYFKVNSEITTIQQLKTFLQSNNLQFVYELATPLTIQLTPTQVKSLLGVNNIWADTGDLELTYFVNNSLVQTIYDMVNVLTS